MPIDTYPGQPQPLTHIGDEFVDLHMSGPSGHVAVGPIFNELLGYAPESPRTMQTLDYPVGPSAYNDRRSAYNDTHVRTVCARGRTVRVSDRTVRHRDV
jgi:hypothetical protein